jgi:hypothetical protein
MILQQTPALAPAIVTRVYFMNLSLIVSPGEENNQDLGKLFPDMLTYSMKQVYSKQLKGVDYSGLCEVPHRPPLQGGDLFTSC